MRLNLTKIVYVILSVFFLKIAVADTFRTNESRGPANSSVTITVQDIR